MRKSLEFFGLLALLFAIASCQNFFGGKMDHLETGIVFLVSEGVSEFGFLRSGVFSTT